MKVNGNALKSMITAAALGLLAAACTPPPAQTAAPTCPQLCPPADVATVTAPWGSVISVQTPPVVSSTTAPTKPTRHAATSGGTVTRPLAPAPVRPGIVAGYVEYPKQGQAVVLNPCGVGNACPGARRNVVTLDYQHPPSRVTFRYVPKPGYDEAGCKAKGGVTEIGPEDRPTCTITKKIIDGSQPMPARISITD